MKKIIKIDYSDMESYAPDKLLEWLKEIDVISNNYIQKSGSLIIEWVQD